MADNLGFLDLENLTYDDWKSGIQTIRDAGLRAFYTDMMNDEFGRDTSAAWKDLKGAYGRDITLDDLGDYVAVGLDKGMFNESQALNTYDKWGNWRSSGGNLDDWWNTVGGGTGGSTGGGTSGGGTGGSTGGGTSGGVADALKAIVSGVGSGVKNVAGTVKDIYSAMGLTGQEAGLGGAAILAALSALTSKPTTTSGTTNQYGTSSQDTSGTTKQDTSGTTSQSTTGTTSQQTGGTTSQNTLGQTAQESSQAQEQVQKVGFDQWYEDLVKAAAQGLPKSGYESFGADMLNLPGGRALGDYMSPYLDLVANPILRRQQEDQARQMQEMNAQRVARGAFGAGRSDLLQNQLLERQALERDNTLGNLYNQAFGSATGLAQQDLGRAFEDWKNLQSMGTGSIGAAGQYANVLKGLAPGATTTTTGATTGLTTGATTGQTLGQTSSNVMGQTTGATTGATTGQTTGQTTGTTSGATTTAGDASYTGTDPSKLSQLAGMAGSIWGLANPSGLNPK